MAAYDQRILQTSIRVAPCHPHENNDQQDDATARQGDKMQYMKEPIATLYCMKSTFREESALKAEVMTHFRLKGTDNDYNQFLTLQGLHYELIPTADHQRRAPLRCHTASGGY